MRLPPESRKLLDDAEGTFRARLELDQPLRPRRNPVPLLEDVSVGGKLVAVTVGPRLACRFTRREGEEEQAAECNLAPLAGARSLAMFVSWRDGDRVALLVAAPDERPGVLVSGKSAGSTMGGA